jgi:hypothetical protein
MRNDESTQIRKILRERLTGEYAVAFKLLY